MYYFLDAEFQQQVLYKKTKAISTHKHSTSSKFPVQQSKSKKISNPPSKNSPPSTNVPPEHTIKTVKSVEDSLVTLKNVFTEELMTFVANKDLMKVNYPPSLSSLQRKALHEVCDNDVRSFL